MKLPDERDAACKAKVEQEDRTKGMAAQVADAEAKAAKAEAEVARLKKKQTSLVAQVCCWTNCCLLSVECLAAMRLFVFTVTSTSTTR